ncbi:hypothetical protein H5410_017272 [Solanum commersonii]|uniref:Uncharacterized protein n=1 Tax=Solanum commersonii TaxID=4109 RepID=A0A9J5ZYZ2_SOLCO|nr:hypothetical protein H5410_017272 [Solanum commersonii]
MTTEIELAKWNVPINNIQKQFVNLVMRVLVITLTLLLTLLFYRSCLLYLYPHPCSPILGTKIQATLFNKHIETWKDSLKSNKSYYIAKGCLDRVNPNYYYVHKEVELSFADNTIIKATDIEVSTHRFFVGFVSLDHVDKLSNCAILVSMNPLIEKEYSKRQNDGAFLEKMKDALVTLGTFEISTISMSSVLINPQFQKFTDLVHYINHTYVLQCYLNPIVMTNVHTIHYCRQGNEKSHRNFVGINGWIAS